MMFVSILKAFEPMCGTDTYWFGLAAKNDSKRVVLYDLRESVFFDAAHIKGACHFSIRRHDDIGRLVAAVGQKKVLLYCEDGQLSSYVASVIRHLNLNVGILVGGFEKFKVMTPNVWRFLERID